MEKKISSIHFENFIIVVPWSRFISLFRSSSSVLDISWNRQNTKWKSRWICYSYGYISINVLWSSYFKKRWVFQILFMLFPIWNPFRSCWSTWNCRAFYPLLLIKVYIPWDHAWISDSAKDAVDGRLLGFVHCARNLWTFAKNGRSSHAIPRSGGTVGRGGGPMSLAIDHNSWFY